MVFSKFFNKKLSAEGEVFYDLGNIYLQKNDFHKAQEYFQKALKTDPDHPQLLSILEEIKDKTKPNIQKAGLHQNSLIQLTPTISEDYFKYFAEHHYHLKKAHYGQENWVLYFEKNKNMTHSQQIIYSDEIPLEQIQTHQESQYYISETCFDGKKWLLVFTYSDMPIQQEYFSSATLPKSIIQENAEMGYSVVSMTKADNWFVVMQRDSHFTNVGLSLHKNFPDVKISKIWKEDKYISQVIYTGEEKAWLLIYGDSDEIIHQGYYNDEPYPLIKMKNLINEGYSISHLAFGNEIWSNVYSEFKKPSEPLIEVHPITEEQEGETLEDILLELDGLVGLANIKEEINRLADFIKIQKIKEERGLKRIPITVHSVFSGNPGTGKTTIARIMGRVFKALGMVNKGHLVEVTRADLVADYIGQTSSKTTEVLNRARDGILFIDEAYALNKGKQDFGNEAIEAILKRMDDERDRLIVIVAGYTKEISAFIDSNPGLQSRFKTYLHFPDYSAEELLEILRRMMVSSQHQLTFEAEELLLDYFSFLVKSKDKNFGNARLVRNIFEELLKVQSERLAKITASIDDLMLTTIALEDVQKVIEPHYTQEKKVTTADLLLELNGLVGLQNIKEDIENLQALIKVKQIREAKGLSVSSLSLHSIFYGPPGTGKTTIARFMGKIFKSLGLLSKGHLVEVSRSDLVADYVGQTATKTEKVLDSARHGILFVDEAYSLHKQGNDFGHEALEIILKRMEDERNQMVVIFAGYEKEMNALLDSNPGLRSRFSRYFFFNDFTPEELTEIYFSFLKKSQNEIAEDGKPLIRDFMREQYQRKNQSFGNARFVRNFFEKCIQARASRIVKKESFELEDITTIEKEDILQAMM